MKPKQYTPKTGDYVWIRTCHGPSGTSSRSEKIARVRELTASHVMVVSADNYGTDNYDLDTESLPWPIVSCGCTIRPVTQPDLPELAAWRLLHEA